MGKALVQLAGDMSSFYNLDNETAWEKIRSGISGETEPLKELGINMSVANLEAYAMAHGINKAYKEMSQAEQTTLRYNYLISVTKDAQGDFARTLGSSFANQLRVAKMNIESLGVSIGSIFLPAVMKMTKGRADPKIVTQLINVKLAQLGNS
jgi:Glu-tRNA(Gln) amidotransferase subunit E-like FAD-binding protein